MPPPKKSKTLVFYYINENEGGLDPIYKEDGLEYWMCPHGIPLNVFDAAEDAIWKELANVYSVKKDGLTHDEVIAAVRKATSS
jgi:hypothetical protein